MEQGRNAQGYLQCAEGFHSQIIGGNVVGSSF